MGEKESATSARESSAPSISEREASAPSISERAVAGGLTDPTPAQAAKASGGSQKGNQEQRATDQDDDGDTAARHDTSKSSIQNIR
jgi:hypothetical protein